MPDIVKIVLQLFYGILVALAVRIIDLRPSGDPWFNQVPKVIERDALLIALGTLAPLRPRTNQADVAFQSIPKLRQFIEPKFPQPSPHTRHSGIAFARVNIFVGLNPATAHRPEFNKNETFSVEADSFLSEEDRSAVSQPDEQRNENEERRTNHQCSCRGKDIENAFEVVIGRGAS